MSKENKIKLWEFIRGDLSSTAFEKWIYESSDIETFLGKDLYFHTIETKFSSREEVHQVKEKLRKHLLALPHMECLCLTLPDLACLDMGEDTTEAALKTLVEQKDYGAERWWLGLFKCQKCDQNWLLAEESRQNDVYLLQRLEASVGRKIMESNQWPSRFESLEDLFKIGHDMQKKVHHIDPLNSSELRCSVTDLIQARPNITISEMASLLNIEDEVIEKLVSELQKDKK